MQSKFEAIYCLYDMSDNSKTGLELMSFSSNDTCSSLTYLFILISNLASDFVSQTWIIVFVGGEKYLG